MQTVLRAADRGGRMEPLSSVAPTPMLPVGDRPLVAHAADVAVDAGTDELVFVVEGDDRRIRAYFGTRYRGVPVAYANRGESSGALGALRAARGRLEDRVAVLDGRCFYGDDVAALFEHDASVAVHRAPDAATDGGTADRAVGDVDGAASPGIDAGAYVFPAGAVESLDALPDGDSARRGFGDVDGPSRGLREVVDGTLPEGHEPAVVELEDWMPVERPADLVDANALAVARTESAASKDASATGAVRVADSATVERSATLDGPVLVADGATVGRDAVVRGPVVVGPDAAVGTGSTVESAVLFDGATVGDAAKLRGGVLGPRCPVPGGARVAGVAGTETRGAAALVARGTPTRFRYR